ncbi:MAG: beta strand repeat-containing protein, partial [Phascolarctobacterium sp.]
TIGSGEGAGIQFKSGNNVSIYAPMLDLQVKGGIIAERDAENPWTGSYLVINTINDEGASGKVIIDQETGNAIEASADVRIYGQAEITSGENGIMAGLAGTNSGSVEITKGTTIKADNYGILAEGGSVTLDSSNNNIVAKGDAIHAVSVEVNPEGTAYKTGGWVYVEGGHIESTEGKAVYSDNGTIYINVGGDHTTTMKGDVLATNGSQVNIKLTDADSSWTGYLDNQGSNVEMTMKNGALWTNGAGAMHINSFTGTETIKDAAYVVRNEGDLTIDYLNGAVNFIYEHEGDGDKVEDYTAGDTIIKSAEAGSTVKLITNKNDKFDINNLNSYKEVLNALAQKLVYSEYASGSRNLYGYLAIAEGLTSSSAELDVRSITFSNTDGRGSYIEVYEEGITGSDENSRFDQNGVIDDSAGNGTIIYNFPSQSGVNMVIPSLKVQAVDNALDVIVNSVETLDFKEKVFVSADNSVTINGKVNINNGWVNAIDNAGGNVVLNNDVTIYSGGKGLIADTVVKTEAQQQVDRAGTIDTNGALKITTYGIAALANGGTININNGGSFDTRYGEYPDAMVVTSDAIVAMEKIVTPYGDASEAQVFQGVVNIKGNENYCIDIQSNGNALYSEGGIININQDNAASYVQMTGFISGHASETGVAPVFNVNLTNEKSRWEGRVRVDENAQINLTLQDGANWATYRYYQDDKNTPQYDLNNRVSNFVGSTADQKAGIIRMTDYIDLTLENYSGNTILYYDHLMWYDGTEKWHYEDGVQKADVHIGSAAEGSEITVMTDSYNIDKENTEQVNKVLNTLASFLVYDGYVKGENNLTGYVAIAESLSSSSLWTALDGREQMSFDESGRGYYEGTVPGVFTTAITGTEADKEYVEAGVIPYNDIKDVYDYTTYNFTEGYNNQVVVPEIHAYGGLVNVNSDLHMQVDGTMDAGWEKTLNVTAPSISMNTEAASAIVSNGGTVTINSDVDIEGTGNGLESYFAMQGYGTTRPSYLTINGDVDITTEGNAVAAKGGDITINGVVNLESSTDTIVAQAYNQAFYNRAGKVNIKGGEITSNGGYAVYNEGSQVTINNNGDTTTIVNGNIKQKDAIVGEEYFAPTTTLKLTDADSEWNGSLEAYGGNTFNLTLQNGATWTDAVVDNGAGNTISNFVGGISNETSGRINRHDTRDLTINNYSGFTSIFYEHDAVDYTQFAAGDTIIKSAAAGSEITLITQHGGIDTTDGDVVKAALNALAGKLYYTGYMSGQENLSGKLMIAESLTGDSSLIDLQDIEFNPNNGQGTFGQGPFVPDHQTDTEFTTAINGNREQAYVYAGVAKADAEGVAQYLFEKDSTITTSGAAVNTSKNVNIDASGKALNLDVTDTSAVKGINNSAGTLDITAATLKVNVNANASSSNATANAGVYAKGGDAVTNISGNVQVAVNAANAGNSNVAWGVAAEGGAKINIAGNVTVKADDGGYGVQNGGNGYSYSGSINKGVAAIIVDNASIVIDGNVDIKADGNGVLTDWYATSTIDILGGGTIEVNKEVTQDLSGVSKGNYALETCAGGHIAMNYDRANNTLGDKTVNIKGNLGMLYSGNGSKSSLTLALINDKSTWTGIMHNTYYGTDKASNGNATLYLQNGATWTNEQWGDLYKNSSGNTGAYTGSIWENFIGGASEAKAGNIYQKDSKNINLVNYSGWTNVYYDHNVAEDGAISFVGGDTIITNATAESGVVMKTNKVGITEDNLDDVLNSLANKLYYKGYTDEATKDNLTGKLVIAEGLTSSEAQWKGKITFNSTNGQGTFDPNNSGADDFDEVGPINVTGSYYKDTYKVDITTNTIVKGENEEAIKFLKTGSNINAEGYIVEAKVESDLESYSNALGISAVNYTTNHYYASTHTITAKEFNVNLQANSSGSAFIAYEGAVITLNGDMNVIAKTSANNAINGINLTRKAAYGWSGNYAPSLTINGNLSIRDGENFGVSNGNTSAAGETNVNGIIADGFDTYSSKATTLTVNGDVDLYVDGTAVVSSKGGVVNFNGGGSIKVNRAPADGVSNYAMEIRQTYESGYGFDNKINLNA